MRILTLAEGERMPEVTLQVGAFLVLLDGGQKRLVDLLLILFPLLADLVLLLLGLEDVAFLLGRLFSGLATAEIVVVELRRQLDARDVDRGGRGQQVALVDASQRAAVDLEGACNA